ncbi:MAG: hypothetical protein FJX84_08120 [Bacteroidetes bacterium]|nr:hypothetical protein [Bacteroidota bacterium]
MLKNFLISFLLILSNLDLTSQTHLHADSIHRDTHYMIIENKVKSKFLGNAWHIPIGYSVGSAHDFEIGLGRSYKRSFCGGAGCIFATNSWGLGYGISSKSGVLAQSARIYYGYNFFYFPPFTAGIRGDYIYDLTNQVHYIKPSFGFSFILGELFYSYGLKLNDGIRVHPSHAFTLRINMFYKLKKWEEHRPNRC